MQIHELAALSGNPASGNVLAIDTGSVTRKIDYTALANAIVEQYNGSTLAGSAQTVQAAINALNTSIGETAESIDTQAINQSYGALFPDTFWTKLNLINADCNQNSEVNNPINYTRLYHITTEKILHFDHALTVSTTDATLQVADRIYAQDGTFISTNNWKRSITIPANAYFRLVFRAQPDDTSVTLDIETSMAKVTFTMASALDDYSTTQATTAAIAASAATKVNVAQGAANAGKALIVGNDGNVTLGEAGVPEAVKMALLNLLQHVVYDTADSTLYSALEAALEVNYNAWLWKLSTGQIQALGATISYDEDAGQIYFETRNNRMCVYTSRGILPILDAQGGEYTDKYPIPIPSTAGKVSFSVTPDIQWGFSIFSTTGEAYTRLDNSGFLTGESVHYFDSGANQALTFYMRADSSNSDFTAETEPTEVVVAFEQEDYYNRPVWAYHNVYTRQLVVGQGGTSVDADASKGYDEGIARISNGSYQLARRRYVCAKRGLTQYIYDEDGTATGLYPIPIPVNANRYTITVSPAQQINAHVTKYANGLYRKTGASTGWINSGSTISFTADTDQFLILALRVNSSNAEYTTSTEPKTITIEYEEA